MILPLELLCQAVLAYETFKALKTAPPARKRRNANLKVRDNGDDRPKQSAYAANKRKRGMKVMLRAWLLYAIAIPLENILSYSLGWFIPFYASFRTLAVLIFVFYHKTGGDIAYTNFLLPFLKPRELSLDFILGWVNEVLDVTCYVAALVGNSLLSILSMALLPFKQVIQYIKQTYASLFTASKEMETLNEEGNDLKHADSSLLQVPSGDHALSKTPRRSKQSNKPRLSQIATPYVPGHVVADESSLYPPIQPRLHPSERSMDDLPAFQEAMDRAQAAFYEVSSPPGLSSGLPKERYRNEDEGDDTFLPLPGQKSPKRSRKSPAKRRTSREADPVNEEGPVTHAEAGIPNDVIPVSAKAKGKRRQIDLDYIPEEAPPSESPEKVLKRTTFEQDRRANGHSHAIANGHSHTSAKVAAALTTSKAKPARPKVQAGSKLPTRKAARAEIHLTGESIAAVVSLEQQKAREAALVARRNAQRRTRNSSKEHV